MIVLCYAVIKYNFNAFKMSTMPKLYIINCTDHYLLFFNSPFLPTTFFLSVSHYTRQQTCCQWLVLLQAQDSCQCFDTGGCLLQRHGCVQKRLQRLVMTFDLRLCVKLHTQQQDMLLLTSKKTQYASWQGFTPQMHVDHNII